MTAPAYERRIQDRILGLKWLLKERVLPSYASDSEPILVGGCGRSGTTLLQVILDAHPDLCCCRETSIMRLGKLNTGKIAVRIGLPIDRVREIADSSARHGEFVDRVCAEYTVLANKKRWADKSPKNIRRMDYIMKCFPKARFVHIIRDGRDAVCSLRTHPKYKKDANGELVKVGTWKPIEKCVDRWFNDVREGLAFRNHPRYTELRYEDLVTEPEETLRELFRFLGARWDPAVLRFYEVPEKSAKDPGFEKPLFRSSMGRWKRDLSPEDTAIFKRTAGSLLIELGYAQDDSWQPDPGAGRRDATR